MRREKRLHYTNFSTDGIKVFRNSQLSFALLWLITEVEKQILPSSLLKDTKVWKREQSVAVLLFSSLDQWGIDFKEPWVRRGFQFDSPSWDGVSLPKIAIIHLDRPAIYLSHSFTLCGGIRETSGMVATAVRLLSGVELHPLSALQWRMGFLSAHHICTIICILRMEYSLKPD